MVGFNELPMFTAAFFPKNQYKPLRYSVTLSTGIDRPWTKKVKPF
jgi:hypothetical protein